MELNAQGGLELVGTPVEGLSTDNTLKDLYPSEVLDFTFLTRWSLAWSFCVWWRTGGVRWFTRARLMKTAAPFVVTSTSMGTMKLKPVEFEGENQNNKMKEAMKVRRTDGNFKVGY